MQHTHIVATISPCRTVGQRLEASPNIITDSGEDKVDLSRIMGGHVFFNNLPVAKLKSMVAS